MISRLAWFIIWTLLCVRCGAAQTPEDLIRLTASSIGASSEKMFSTNIIEWAKTDGRVKLSKLQAAGPIVTLSHVDSKVAAPLWQVVGRATHQSGYSDWEIIFSRETGTIIRVAVQVFLNAEDLPTPPVIHGVRGSGSAQVLDACGALADLCGPSSSDGDRRSVEILFATTRQKVDESGRTTFSGARARAMTFGAARVRIPEDHRLGHIELPGSARLFSISLYERKLDLKRHFVIKDVKALDREDWDQVIRTKKANEALIFVHGFNTTFDQSLYRAAQIVWDLQYQNLSILFSWASMGDVLRYEFDQQSAMVARDSFIELLRILRTEHGISRVNVVAHSMGNYLVLDALAAQANSANAPRISELIMAAPDIDRDLFRSVAPAVRSLVDGLTLYASSADKALAASKVYAGGIPRAGDVPEEGPVTMSGMETIDATAIGDDVLGLNHDVFATVRSTINDIGILISMRPRTLPHQRLREIRRIPEFAAEPRYWHFSR
ncbi:alpha/beta hydrolase [Bosea sp. NPDC003192]|uniref:alpha/beta hydrolase n=1 Tax=Bosea sp. NPDC003192 TaxID=3390551 RepID=UPI003CFD7BCB